jgi:hypothetical protein
MLCRPREWQRQWAQQYAVVGPGHLEVRVVVRLAAGAVVRPREAVERIPSRPKSQLSGADTNKKRGDPQPLHCTQHIGLALGEAPFAVGARRLAFLRVRSARLRAGLR